VFNILINHSVINDISPATNEISFSIILISILKYFFLRVIMHILIIYNKILIFPQKIKLMNNDIYKLL